MCVCLSSFENEVLCHKMSRNELTKVSEVVGNVVETMNLCVQFVESG